MRILLKIWTKKREKRPEIRKANKDTKKETQRAQRRGNALFFCLFAVKCLPVVLAERRKVQPFSTRFTHCFTVFHDVSRGRFLLKNERMRGKIFFKNQRNMRSEEALLSKDFFEKGHYPASDGVASLPPKGVLRHSFFSAEAYGVFFLSSKRLRFLFFQPKRVHFIRFLP